jgi:signal transduction histidine kinase
MTGARTSVVRQGVTKTGARTSLVRRAVTMTGARTSVVRGIASLSSRFPSRCRLVARLSSSNVSAREKGRPFWHPSPRVSKGKLTRQELGWLLTQEAQGAAERLRKGVTALTQAPPPPGADGTDATGVDATLSALDDAMRMLSNLHNRPSNVRGRRGRIDLASLLWEVAPEARVSIEPGSGTEVHGDESEFRRMLHVMLGHGSGSGSVVTIRREGDEVVIGVVLGPDSSVTAETERAWLARMAIRYGGRYELVGSQEVLALPAEGIDARDDVAKLRKELDEARKQGEAYARELAAVWAAGDEPLAPSSYPPPATPAADRHGAVARLSGGVAATLRSLVSPVARQLGELRTQLAASARKSSPDLEAAARGDLEEQLESIRRKLVAVQEFVAELAAVGESDPHELQRQVDLVEIVRAEARALDARIARTGVDVQVLVVPESATRAPARVSPRSIGVLVRELLAHAIAATPRGGRVTVTLHAPGGVAQEEGLGSRIVIDDGGTIMPAAARRSLLGLEVEPGTFGRPSGVGLFVAAEIAAAQGALLEIADVPVQSGHGGGVRVTVTFPRSV